MIIEGKTIIGNRLGKSIGLPTANIIITTEEANNLKLHTGVFASIVTTMSIHGINNSLSSVSMLKDNRYLIETHIIGICNDSDFYGDTLKIALLNKIRDAKVFTSKEDLCDAIKSDKESVELFFKNKKTCKSCAFCYQRDEGYSNYTVTDSSVGCYLEQFVEYPIHYSDLLETAIMHNVGGNCNNYKKGDMWYLDVDMEETGPSDEQIKIWKRNLKINNIIE